MPTGTIVLVNNKVLGTIMRWCQVRKQYLVELLDSGVTQYVDEKYLSI